MLVQFWHVGPHAVFVVQAPSPPPPFDEPLASALDEEPLVPLLEDPVEPLLLPLLLWLPLDDVPELLPDEATPLLAPLLLLVEDPPEAPPDAELLPTSPSPVDPSTGGSMSWMPKTPPQALVQHAPPSMARKRIGCRAKRI